MRSQFRFPGWSIFLMLLSLVGVMFAIEQAHRFSLAFSDGTTFAPLWSTFPRIFLLLLGLMGVAGAAGYGVLFALRRTGVHRLSNAQTWPNRR